MRHNYRKTVRSLWTWLWGRYHVPQNVFLVLVIVLVIVTKISLEVVDAHVSRFGKCMPDWPEFIEISSDSETEVGQENQESGTGAIGQAVSGTNMGPGSSGEPAGELPGEHQRVSVRNLLVMKCGRNCWPNIVQT